ncbi:MAG: translation initiation factor IF-5A [Promethearchaeota archaeon]
MSIRRSQANKLRKGSYLVVEGEPCLVLSNEHSKSGKHGHAKSRITCVGLFDKKKRSLTFPADTGVDVPEINKRTASISYIEAGTVGLMDQESFESFEVDWPDDDELKKKLELLQQDPDKAAASQVEVWDVLGSRVIKRVMSS